MTLTRSFKSQTRAAKSKQAARRIGQTANLTGARAPVQEAEEVQIADLDGSPVAVDAASEDVDEATA